MYRFWRIYCMVQNSWNKCWFQFLICRGLLCVYEVFALLASVITRAQAVKEYSQSRDESCGYMKMFETLPCHQAVSSRFLKFGTERIKIIAFLENKYLKLANFLKKRTKILKPTYMFMNLSAKKVVEENACNTAHSQNVFHRKHKEWMEILIYHLHGKWRWFWRAPGFCH